MNMNASGATGARLAHEKIDQYRSLGAFGKPVYQSHVQLRAMLKAKCGDTAANYFARPTYDPDLGELHWTSEVRGEVRAWHEMTEEEKIGRALDLEVIRSQLLGFTQELRSQQQGASSFASLLEQAVRVPEEGNFLYFVGDQPVIAFWGFEDRNGKSVDPAAWTPPRYSNAGSGAAAAVPAVETVTLEKVGFWRRWRWLLLMLGLLLLLLLFLRACTPVLGPGGLDLPFFDKKANDATVSEALDPSDEQRRLREAGEFGVVLPNGRVTGEGQPIDMAESLGQAAPGDALLPDPAVDGSSPEAMPETQASEPPVPETSSDAPEPSVPPAPESAPTDMPQQTDPPLTPDQSGKQDNAPSGVPPLAPARPMEIPGDPGRAQAMQFLEGEWKAGDGLADKVTNQPLDLSLKFGDKGQGEITYRKGKNVVCSGPVHGNISGGKLGIQGDQIVPCSDGTQYGAPKIECARDSNGHTQCVGVNPDGSRYAMGMERK